MVAEVLFCSMCRCTAVFITQPLDLIKNRMQLSGKSVCVNVQVTNTYLWLLYFVQYGHCLFVCFCKSWTVLTVCGSPENVQSQCGSLPTKHLTIMISHKLTKRKWLTNIGFCFISALHSVCTASVPELLLDLLYNSTSYASIKIMIVPAMYTQDVCHIVCATSRLDQKPHANERWVKLCLSFYNIVCANTLYCLICMQLCIRLACH